MVKQYIFFFQIKQTDHWTVPTARQAPTHPTVAPKTPYTARPADKTLLVARQARPSEKAV